jgi:hypothetical protein
MNSLAQALERFNRKERNLVVRAALGHEDKALRLSERFRAQINEKLDIEVPENAWWGTDYHISWLAGALAIFVKGDAAIKDRYPNVKAPPFDVNAQDEDLNTGKEPQLVKGNQEDVDLVIATDNDLVLIEAKAHSTFGDEQIISKLARLDLLYDFYENKLRPTPDRVVHFHFLFLSPTEPKHLEAHRPIWAKDAKIPWIPLRLISIPPILGVTRCDEDGHSKAGGTFWRVIAYT